MRKMINFSVLYYLFEIINSQIGHIKNNLRFPGQYAEQNLNLYYNWHRYYSPKIGRYYKNLVEFEILKLVDDIYFYGWDNPLIYFDLDGRKSYCRQYYINAEGKSKHEGEKFAKTVCNGCNGFEWRWLKKPECGDECFKKHEEAHIVWFEILRPDACRGRAKGSNPALEPGDKPKTECYAYEVSSKCMEEMRIRVNMSGYTQKCRTFIKINYQSQIKHMKEFCEAAGGWPWW